MLIDYHLHTTFSADSIQTPREAIERAIELGFDEITVTDHMDLLPEDIHDETHILNAEKYFTALEALRDEYRAQITVNIGAEIGLNRGMVEKSAEFVRSYHFDFIIASLHRINYQSMRTPGYLASFGSKENLYRAYYHNLGELLDEFDEFDICGHLDFIRRVMPFKYEPDDYFIELEYIESLLKRLISRGKGIEINTSGMRHPSHATLPHLPIVMRYHELGGEILTIGADSHRTDHVGWGLKEITELLPSMGITKLTTFKKRKPTFVEI